MIHTADGALLYSPRDLVAYLEGDFAAWCERMKLVNLLCHLMQYAEGTV